MTKLTDSQLIVMSSAAARDDGFAVLPRNMNKAAASKVGSSLVRRKLMREIRSKPGIAVWREDEDGRPISLMITRAGRAAIGVENERSEDRTAVEHKGSTPRQKIIQGDKKAAPSNTRRDAPRPPIANQAVALGAAGPDRRPGTKQSLLIDLLSAEAGASIGDLVKATGWLAHTTRAALTGLRKRGFSIERSRGDDAVSVYRIVAADRVPDED